MLSFVQNAHDCSRKSNQNLKTLQWVSRSGTDQHETSFSRVRSWWQLMTMSLQLLLIGPEVFPYQMTPHYVFLLWHLTSFQMPDLLTQSLNGERKISLICLEGREPQPKTVMTSESHYMPWTMKTTAHSCRLTWRSSLFALSGIWVQPKEHGRPTTCRQTVLDIPEIPEIQLPAIRAFGDVCFYLI